MSLFASHFLLLSLLLSLLSATTTTTGQSLSSSSSTPSVLSSATSSTSANAVSASLSVSATSTIMTSSSSTAVSSSSTSSSSSSSTVVLADTIKFATTWPLTGQYAAMGPIIKEAFEFCFDLIAERGGITLNGKQYNVSLVAESDDSSQQLQRRIFTDYCNDESITFLFCPYNAFDGAIAVNAACKTPRLMIAPHLGILQYFLQNEWLFGSQNLDVAVFAALQEQQESTGTDSHTHLQEAAVFARATDLGCQATFQLLLYNIQNAQVPVIVNYSLPQEQLGVEEWLHAFQMIPQQYERIGLLVVIALGSDFANIAAALQQSRLKPKIAFFPSLIPDEDQINTQLMTIAQGWISVLTWTPQLTFTSTFNGTLFKSNQDFVQQFTQRFNRLPGSIDVDVASAVELALAALHNTENLTFPAMQTAMESLQGSTFYGPVNLARHWNSAHQAMETQIQDSQMKLVEIARYPADWNWDRIQPGNAIPHSQDASQFILASFLAVLGSWVSVILVEQAVFTKRKRENYTYVIWIVCTALCLSISAIWCCDFVSILAVQLSPDTFADLDLSFTYSVSVALLALLPVVVCLTAGQFIIISAVDRVKKTTEVQVYDSNSDRQQEKRLNAERAKQLAVDWHAQIRHLIENCSARLLYGSAFMTAGIVSGREMMQLVAMSDVSVEENVASVIGASILTLILVCVAQLIFFHAVRLRWAGAFIFAAAVIIDWQINQATIQWLYDPHRQQSRSAVFNLTGSKLVISIVCSAVAAATAIVFVGLQFNMMKLSRNALSAHVATLEIALEKSQSDCKSFQQAARQWKVVAVELNRLNEMMQLLRPLSRSYALTLANQLNIENSPFIQSIYSKVSSMKSNSLEPSACSAPLAPTLQLFNSNNMPVHTIEANIQPINQIQSQIQVQTHTQHLPHVQLDAAVQPTALNSFQQKCTSYSSEVLMADFDHCDKNQDDALYAMRLRHAIVDLPMPRPMVRIDSNKSLNNQNDINPLQQQQMQVEHGEPEQDVLATRSASSLPTSLNDEIAAAAVLMTSQFSRCSLSSVAGHTSPAQPATKTTLTTDSNSASSNTHSNNNLPTQTKSPLQHQTTMDIATTRMKAKQSVSISLTRKVQNKENFLTVSAAFSNDTDPTQQQLKTSTLQLLTELMTHPVCVELLKDELMKLHSVEMIMFLLDVSKYKQLPAGKIKSQLAQSIFTTYLPQNSEHQVNVSQPLRERIAHQLQSTLSDEVKYSSELFAEAEKELLQLINVNLMKNFAASSCFQLCREVLNQSLTRSTNNLLLLNKFQQQDKLQQVTSQTHLLRRTTISRH